MSDEQPGCFFCAGRCAKGDLVCLRCKRGMAGAPLISLKKPGKRIGSRTPLLTRGQIDKILRQKLKEAAEARDRIRAEKKEECDGKP